MIKFKNIFLVIKDQMPIKRFFHNFFITKNGLGLLYKDQSHISQSTGTPKVQYNTRVTAAKAAEKMKAKYGMYFSVYKCLFCDGFHIGKNRNNDTTLP